jgi:Transposase DDE domain
MVEPTFADYVDLIFNLFERFWQHHSARAHRGHPFLYHHKVLIVFFVIMQQRHIFRFKAQHRWLKQHPDMRASLQFDAVPHRSTLSRRYKALYDVVRDFIAFLGVYAEDLDPRLSSQDLETDKSLFKANGPVWHQSDRKEGRIPDKLRHLDTDASWSKSGYHGWVYGYGLHLVNNRAGFPKMVQVETASVSETVVIDQQADQLIDDFRPATVSTDNSYAQANRIRQWAKRGVVLLSPAAKWTKGRYAKAYHDYIDQPEQRELLQSRRTAIEPIFDLVAKALGTTGRQKQLAVQGLANVRPCLALATLTVQVAMIANSIWELSLRNISTLATALT